MNYRGVEVGMVHKIELAPNSASADIHILIHNRYASLVRAGSAFWNTSGIHASGGILKGIELRARIAAHALHRGDRVRHAERKRGARVKAGTVFFLYDKPKDEWLAWSAKIPLGGAAEKAGSSAATGGTKAPAKDNETEKPAQRKSGRPVN